MVLPALPSTTDASPIDAVGSAGGGVGGRSSSTITPLPTPSEMPAPAAFDSCTVNASSGSTNGSPWIVTSTVFVVSPGANVSEVVTAS